MMYLVVYGSLLVLHVLVCLLTEARRRRRLECDSERWRRQAELQAREMGWS